MSRIAQPLPIEHSPDNNSIAIDPVFVLRKSYAFVRFHSIATGEDILVLVLRSAWEQPVSDAEINGVYDHRTSNIYPLIFIRTAKF